MHYLEKELYQLFREDPSIFEFLQKGSLDGVWYWDLENPDNEWMSAQFWKTLGYDPETKKHLAAEWQDLINAEDLQAALNNFKKHCADPTHPYDQVVRYRHKNGSTVWMRCRGIAIRDESGKPIRMLGAHNELTQQKKAEEDIIKERDYAQKILNTVEAIIVAIDRDGRVSMINSKGCRLLGCSEKEIKGQHWFSRFLPQPDGMENVYPFFLKLIAGEIEAAEHFENSIITKAKGIRQIAWHNALIYDKDGKIAGTLSYGDDITERKQAEIKIRAQTETLQQIFNSAPNILAIVNDEGRIEKINHKGVAFSGKEKQQIIGSLGGEVFNCITSFNGEGCSRNSICSQCPVRTRVESTLMTGIPYNDDEGQLTFLLDGKEVTLDILISTSLIEVDETKKVLLAISDITKIKQAEKEKAALSAKLEAVQRIESIGNLAGGIAHDFNNILFPIVGLSEMLLEDLPKDSPEYENAVEIYNAGRRGSDLVRQILDFSRQSEHQMIPIRIQQVLKEVMKLCRATIPVDISISQDIQSDCSLVQADPSQIHQIAMNLITNAYHAVEQKGGEISVRLREVEIGLDPMSEGNFSPGNYALLSVSDTGVGIDAALIDKIFEPYFTTKEQGKGTGLGLAVVYGIVKEHHGHIKVYGELGKGTTFNVYLPTMSKNEKSVFVGRNEDVPSGNGRILLVDDDEAIAKLEKQMLDRLGYEVTMRVNSLEALAVFKARPNTFDLIISDLTMPNMTGDQLARELILVRPDIPIIICTGFSERLNQEKATGIGVKGFLMKPIVKADMAKMVRKVLDEVKAEKKV